MIEIDKRKIMGEYKVVKANYLVNLKTPYAYSEVEKKLICSIISKVLPSDEDFKDYEIILSDLGLKFIEQNNQSKYLKNDKKWDKISKEELRQEKNIFSGIMQKTFTLNGKNNVAWFSYMELNEDNTIITCRFDKALKPYLLQLNQSFTEYHLKNIMSLKSAYSIDTYELCKQFMPDVKSEEKIVNFAFRTIDINEFRELLHIPKSYLSADINRLLERVCKDISDNTNLFVSYKMQKKGRAFSSIRFDIERKSYREERLLKKEQKTIINVQEKKSIKPKKVEKIETLETYEDKYETYQELDFEDYQEQKAKENFVKIHKNQTSISDYLIEVDEKLDNE